MVGLKWGQYCCYYCFFLDWNLSKKVLYVNGFECEIEYYCRQKKGYGFEDECQNLE